MQITAVEKGSYYFPSSSTTTSTQYGWNTSSYTVQRWSLPPITYYRNTPTVTTSVNVEFRPDYMNYYIISLADGSKRYLYQYLPILVPQVGDIFSEKIVFGVPIYIKINDSIQYSNYVIGAGALAFAVVIERIIAHI